ncbi:MAG: type II toxin-antitoxin system VapC family toxin [Proteobacteria bacterium]|nr:type II toxin-antitoxin system VapC family toxin [Pseudomonadota bacterium]NOG61318.1 type II toxin-antitoxin system VapC family toxin [Pseudomonadota bacterium]
MKQNKEQHVGLDSHCLSYLLDGIAGVSCPTDSLAQERISLLRIWFYRPGTFYITETVLAEVAQIRDIYRRELHDGFINSLFLDYPVRIRAEVKNRAKEFETYHPKHNDCLILAEAEELNLDILLSYDNDFLKRLSNVSEITRLMKPVDYWVSLNIPKGSQPVTVPHHTNPLSKETWWVH